MARPTSPAEELASSARLWRRRVHTAQVLILVILVAGVLYVADTVVGGSLFRNPYHLSVELPQAAGLHEGEVEEFAGVVRSIRDDREVGVLLIDHNLGLILSVCDRIHVLDEGRTLAEGTPGEIRANLDVSTAYFGRHDRER